MKSITSQINYLSIIGAQRSGSTFLYHLLDHSPYIQMYKPIRPESRFFMEFPNLTKDEFISKYGNFSTSSKFLGEKCTSYLEYPEVGKRIKNLFPEAKTLVVLRDPVDRALSNYQFTKDHGFENRSLEDVFLKNTPAPIIPKNISVDPFDYLGRGYYSKYLIPYMNLFKDQIKVVVLEELIQDDKAVIEIFDFLEIPSIDLGKIDRNKKINHSSIKDSLFLQEIKAYLNELYQNEIVNLAPLINTDIKKYWNK